MLGFDTCLGSAGGGELRLRCLHEAGALNVSKGCAVLSRSVMSDSCDPRDCSPPGSSIHGIFQARILEWIAISFSKIKENQVQF